MSAHFNSPTGQTPEGMYILDPVTGLPTLPGGGSSGGGASAAEITTALTATNAPMQADLDALAGTVVNNKLLIGGARDKWRDGFQTLNATKWDYVTGKAPNDTIVLGGDTSASGFAEIILDHLAAGTTTSVRGLNAFASPYRLGWGASVSQRQAGEATVISVAEVNGAGQRVMAVGETESFFSAPMTISKVVAFGTTAVLIFPAAHNIKFDDIVILSGCPDPRMNVQLRVTQVRNRFSVVIPLTYTAGNYPLTATVTVFRPSKGSANCAGMVLMDSLDANAILFSRGQGSPEFLSANTSMGTSYSAALIPSAQPYAINIQPRMLTEMVGTMDTHRWITGSMDSQSANGASVKRTQAVPDPTKNYAMFVDVVAFPNRLAPIEILSVVKTGTTTATVNTVNPHNLVTGAWVYTFGSRDQTTLANLTVPTTVVVTGPSQLQIVWGTAVTQTYNGGILVPANGSYAAPSMLNTAVMGTAWYNGLLYLGTFSIAPFVMGDVVRLVGVRDVSGAVVPNMSGRFRVVAITPNIQEAGIATGASTTSASPTVLLTETGAIPIGAIMSGSGAPPGVVNSVVANTSYTSSVNATATATQVTDFVLQGVVLVPLDFAPPANSQPTTLVSAGAVIRETSVRLNFARCLDYTRTPVEVTGGHYTADQQQALSIHAPAGMFVTGTTTANQGATASIGTGGLGAWVVRGAPSATADIASAALTTVGATTSAAVDIQGNTGSMQFGVDVTANSGTTPRLITRVQGSFDAGANFVNIYDIGVITSLTDKTTHSPVIPAEFRFIRYVRDLRGTTPSITHSVVRTARPMEVSARQRRMLDRVLALTTAAASTEWLYVGGCTQAQMMATAMAGQSVAAILKVQLCQGDPTVAANWYDMTGAPTLTTSASAPVVTAPFAIGNAKLARLVTTTAGTGIVAETYELALTAWE